MLSLELNSIVAGVAKLNCKRQTGKPPGFSHSLLWLASCALFTAYPPGPRQGKSTPHGTVTSKKSKTNLQTWHHAKKYGLPRIGRPRFRNDDILKRLVSRPALIIWICMQGLGQSLLASVAKRLLSMVRSSLRFPTKKC